MNRKLLLLTLAAVFAVAALSAVASDDSDAADPDYNRYYYDQLDDLGKQVYDACVDQVTESNLTATINDVDLSAYGEDLETAFQAAATKSMNPAINLINYDQMFFYPFMPVSGNAFSGSGTLTSCDISVTFEVDSNFTAAVGGGVTVAKAISDLKTTLADVTVDTTSTYTIVGSIHDYVGNLITYPKTYGSDSYVRSIYRAVLGDHQTVCEGYAKTFKAVCDIAGIPCILVSGPAGTTGEKESHMWNLVKMDDSKWYLVDCTWDDQQNGPVGAIVYNYFLAGSTTVGFDSVTIGESHESIMYDTYGVTVPTIDTKSYDDNNQSGTLGDNIAWVYNNVACTLTLTGEGAMTAKEINTYPWNAYKGEIKYVTVGDGITTIAAYAFSGMTLSGVSVPWSAATIDANAFGGLVFYDVYGTSVVDYSGIRAESFTLVDEKMVMNDRDLKGYFYVESTLYATVDYSHTEALVYPDPPQSEGYTVTWGSQTVLEDGVRIDAVFTPVVVSYDFQSNGASVKSGSANYFDTVTAPSPDPTKPGTSEAEYEFAGWVVGSGTEYVTFPYELKGDTVFNAVFTEIPYCDYSFMVDTTVYAEGTLLAGELIPTPTPDPTKAAAENYEYVFEGWDGYIPTQPISKDVTFDAVFTEYFTGITVSKTMTVTVGAEEMILKPSTAQSIIDQAKADSGTTLTLTLTHGTVKLDATALAAMDADDFEIGIQTFTAKDFDSETAKLIGDATVYSVWAGTSLGTGSITITVPYDTTGKDTSVLKACYIVSAKIKETYDVTFSDGNATFTVPHLSNYAILDTSTPEPTPEGGSTGLPISNEMLIGIVIVLIVIVAAVVIIRRR